MALPQPSTNASMARQEGTQGAEAAIAALQRAEPVLLTDRRAAGAQNILVYAADFCDAEKVNFLASEARGLVCLALPEERIEVLGLQPVPSRGHTVPRKRFAQSIEAASGTSTGISAADRALTIAAAANPSANPEDLVVPGHIFPIICPDIQSPSTDLSTVAVQLCEAATGNAAAVICDLLDEDGNAAGPTYTRKLLDRQGLTYCTVEDSAVRMIEQLPPAVENWQKSADISVNGQWHIQSISFNGEEYLLANPMEQIGAAPSASCVTQLYITDSVYLRRPLEDFGWGQDPTLDHLFDKKHTSTCLIIGMQDPAKLLKPGQDETALFTLVRLLANQPSNNYSLLNFAPNLPLRLEAFGLNCTQGRL